MRLEIQDYKYGRVVMVIDDDEWWNFDGHALSLYYDGMVFAHPFNPAKERELET